MAGPNTEIALGDALTALGFDFDRTEQEAEWVAVIDGSKKQGKDIWVFSTKPNLEIHVAWKEEEWRFFDLLIDPEQFQACGLGADAVNEYFTRFDELLV